MENKKLSDIGSRIVDLYSKGFTRQEIMLRLKLNRNQMSGHENRIRRIDTKLIPVINKTVTKNLKSGARIGEREQLPKVTLRGDESIETIMAMLDASPRYHKNTHKR